MIDVLDCFSPPIRKWFRAALGEPTPPQVAGWPAIQRSENTLIFAPTGSGKTMAAFLWGIDELCRVKGGERRGWSSLIERVQRAISTYRQQANVEKLGKG